MNSKILFLGMFLTGFGASAQLGKNLESKLSGTAQDPINEFPKGMEMYSATHSDNAGISGKYYAKYPVQFMYKTTMNTYKTFTVDQLTFEFDAEAFAGRIHVVNDAPAKLVRNAGTDLSSVWDFYGGGLKDVQKNVAKLFNFYCFNVNCKNYTFGSIMGVNRKGALVDGVLFRSTEDPDVFLFGNIVGNEIVPNNSQYSPGGCFNVFSLDKSKLEAWDSTRISSELIRHNELNKDYVSKSLGELVALPKMVVNDDTREQEYYNIIAEMAAIDKPQAWADKFVYCYINTDWKEEYKGGVLSHRWCTVIAVSDGWTEGSGGRYIPVRIAQNWDGNKYGKSYGNGFQGALVPVSSETIKSFAH